MFPFEMFPFEVKTRFVVGLPAGRSLLDTLTRPIMLVILACVPWSTDLFPWVARGGGIMTQGNVFHHTPHGFPGWAVVTMSQRNELGRSQPLRLLYFMVALVVKQESFDKKLGASLQGLSWLKTKMGECPTPGIRFPERTAARLSQHASPQTNQAGNERAGYLPFCDVSPCSGQKTR